ACRREIEEYALRGAVVSLDAREISHIDSRAAPELHINLTASACIGQEGKNLKEGGMESLFLILARPARFYFCSVRKLA
ncbi:hypothetical protein, partial [Nitrospira sp. BLG_2]|uniref:hypothetical protein n=1 Tax=Nitrospira sp. BLG_2 TaxID=3397507 RepID=UPI003B9F3F29